MTLEQTRDHSRHLHSVYAWARDLNEAVWQQRVLDLLAGVLNFDGAVWGEGRRLSSKKLRIDRAVVHGMPASLLEEYAGLPVADPVTTRFMVEPTQAQCVDVFQHYAGPELEPIKQYLGKYDIRYFLLQGAFAERARYFLWITAYRSEAQPPFTEVDTQRLGIWLPHLLQAQQICRHYARYRKTKPETRTPVAPSAAPLLSSRQKAVLHLLSLGFSYAEAAAQLGTSMETVKAHASVVYKRLGVKNKAEAVFEARQAGLLD